MECKRALMYKMNFVTEETTLGKPQLSFQNHCVIGYACLSIISAQIPSNVVCAMRLTCMLMWHFQRPPIPTLLVHTPTIRTVLILSNHMSSSHENKTMD
jgi:hypothetical protein